MPKDGSKKSSGGSQQRSRERLHVVLERGKAKEKRFVEPKMPIRVIKTNLIEPRSKVVLWFDRANLIQASEKAFDEKFDERIPIRDLEKLDPDLLYPEVFRVPLLHRPGRFRVCVALAEDRNGTGLELRWMDMEKKDYEKWVQETLLVKKEEED